LLFNLAYKSGKDIYTLEVYTLTLPFVYLNPATSALLITGQVAAICVTHDRLAFVYRRCRRIETSGTKLKNSFEIDHYFALYDHSLTKLTDDVPLSSSIRWLTAIVSHGTESEYLLCDPRGQQLLLYHAIDNILIRRFHIGPVNACCLTDGRLVLWIKKPYASSPIGKLHFISVPHLENYAVVAKSLDLLTESNN
jgi:hypothetical protein